jgi:class 3 adenylate cyclase
MSLENLMSESKTSKIVTEAITKKVIILILSILIMLPILDDSFYASDDTLSYNILSKYISNYLSIFSNDSIPNYLPPKLNNSLWDLVVNQKEEVFPIVNITAYQNIFYINSALANFEFRKSELSTAISPEGNVVIIFSLISDIKINALLNIIKTVCLCILVTVATIFFERDVKSLVLDPLEVMIEIVDKVSKDPIKAKNFDNLESGMKTTISKIQKEDQNNNSTKNKKKRLAKEGDEVKIIQSAIMKISALLAIGIGEAGNEIIKENLSNYNDLDPMVQGRKKNYIFGFCDIRGFPLVNEALQEQTMVFLNQIADIVHSSVDLFNGATNKNIGDAFLMVWKLPNDFQLEVFGNELMETPREVNAINKLNKRLILHSEKNEESGTENFLKINSYNSTINNKINFNNNNKNNLNNNNNLNNSNIINNNINYNNSDNNKYVYNNFNNNNDLNTNQNFLRINNEDYLTITKSSNNKALGIRSDAEAEPQQKISAEVRLIADSAVFGFLKVIAKINRNLRILAYRKNPEILAKIKDFKVNMGFGLHVGWAIEGAIGSAYKIDASYLSPNVNMAARLEGATRQYGVSILISGSVHDLLSPEVKSLCRLIDVVTVKGSTKPVKFYTIDLNENLKPSKHYKKDFTDKQRRLTQMVKKKKIKKESEETGLYAIMIKKKYFRVMFKNARPKFFNGVFKEAFGFYIKGDWASAAGKFRECLKIYQNDGPAKTLLKYILENNSLAPADWEGFRALTSK